MKKITTVRGDISPDDLGFTTLHEHLLADLLMLRNQVGFIPPIPKSMLALQPENLAFLRTGASLFSDECSTLGDVDFTVRELAAFKKIGGRAVCDASPIGFRGDVRDLRSASELSDVHVVCATGLYHANAQPEEFAVKSEQQLMTYFTAEIREGIGDTGIRPGFLKCALNVLNGDGSIHELEIKTLRACARVAANTGLSLHVHVAVPLTGEHILQAVEIAVNQCGLQPERLLVLHLDSFLRTPARIADYYSTVETERGVNIDLQMRILDQGVNISFDSWGMQVNTLPDDYDRIKALAGLLRLGYAGQIVTGHDIYDKSRGITQGSTGFTGFANFALPILKQLGVADADINKLTTVNPARILAH